MNIVPHSLSHTKGLYFYLEMGFREEEWIHKLQQQEFEFLVWDVASNFIFGFVADENVDKIPFPVHSEWDIEPLKFTLAYCSPKTGHRYHFSPGRPGSPVNQTMNMQFPKYVCTFQDVYFENDIFKSEYELFIGDFFPASKCRSGLWHSGYYFASTEEAAHSIFQHSNAEGDAGGWVLWNIDVIKSSENLTPPNIKRRSKSWKGMVRNPLASWVNDAIEYHKKEILDCVVNIESDNEDFEKIKATRHKWRYDTTIPYDVSSFSELHDYCDANEFMVEYEKLHNLNLNYGNDDDIESVNAVQNAIDKWIKDGGILNSIRGIDNNKIPPKIPPKIRRKKRSWKGVVRNPYPTTGGLHFIKWMGGGIKLVLSYNLETKLGDIVIHASQEGKQEYVIDGLLPLLAQYGTEDDYNIYTEKLWITIEELEKFFKSCRNIPLYMDLLEWKTNFYENIENFEGKEDIERQLENLLYLLHFNRVYLSKSNGHKNENQKEYTPPPKITRKTRSWKGTIRNP